MLSTQAFNGLLKTLEEPPEHVKFIFATTEIRKVPITVLSRCQRFDLRRIGASDLVGLFTTILGKEGVEFEPDALAMIARAAEGSARDGLSLLDQAIAHGGGRVEVNAVRGMLGLADRARIVDLFEHVVKGDAAAALAEFSAQYEAGASPPVVLTDLADFTHLVTRMKYVPDAAGDQSLSEVERVRGVEFANSIAVTALSRMWQMLLKGIPETEASSRPAGAAEMVIIRLAHAANLPSPEEAARRLAELSGGEGSGNGTRAPQYGGNGGQPTAQAALSAVARTPEAPVQRVQSGGGTVTMLRPVPQAEPASLPVGRIETTPAAQPTAEPKVPVKSVADIAELCTKNRDIRLRALVRAFVRPVSVEAGRLEIGLANDAPKSLVNDLSSRLQEWTGIRWMVILSREPGGPTLAEAETMAQEARVADARQDPDVAAILQRFPGAKIMDVRIKVQEAEDEPETVEAAAVAESAEGDILPGDDIEH
jgi:DNA polymerase-3 subunit gamma/tau